MFVYSSLDIINNIKQGHDLYILCSCTSDKKTFYELKCILLLLVIVNQNQYYPSSIPENNDLVWLPVV